MKALGRGCYTVRPFKTYKTHEFTYIEGGTNSPHVSITEAERPPATWQWSGSLEPSSSTGIYKRTLYESLFQLFYDFETSLTSSVRYPPLNLTWSPLQSTGSYVISVSQNVFGEKIRPNSFRLTTAQGTGSIVDDGLGKLYCTSNSSSIIGNIFYPTGIIAIAKIPSSSLTSSVINHQGLYLSSSNSITVRFTSQLTLYEHTAICTMEQGEFNYTTNPSLWYNVSSSVSGSSKLIDNMLTGSLTPYFTQVGLYTDTGDLVAIGKVPRPLRREVAVDQSVIVKFDI